MKKNQRAAPQPGTLKPVHHQSKAGAMGSGHLNPQKRGSSRDLGEVEVDRQGAGKLAVSKHTTTITLLSPCIILILP
ncbi:hypothetical protein, partial [Aeromonas caviae]|uniref:hypothetical protein n=1 Tax=Aeromonas caviae TaxID=648 RepID=UPI0038CFAC54